MKEDLEDIVDWEEAQEQKVFLLEGKSLAEYAESTNYRLLDFACCICFGDRDVCGSFKETEDNKITYQSRKKPWHYKSIMKECLKEVSVKRLAEICDIAESSLKSNLREMNLRGRGRVNWDVEDSWEEARRKSIQRDGSCVVCGLENEKHQNKYNRSLHVHHVVPQENFDEKRNANSLENLVCLCETCHGQYEATPRNLFLRAFGNERVK